MAEISKNIEKIIIKINAESSIPKYIQVANSITRDIYEGKILTGKKLPSINDLSEKTSLSRDTIEKAYKLLKSQNLIYSVQGVGNFATISNSESTNNILFLINKPSSYKIEVYNAFVETIGTLGQVNMYLYYCDENIFIDAITKNLHKYDFFVVMPHFKNKVNNHVSYTPNVIKTIETIPKEKLLLIDNSHAEISGNFISIYQNYKDDIFQAMQEAMDQLKNYKKIILVYPQKSVFPYPQGILTGFIQFCEHYNFSFEILDQIYKGLEFQSKEAYITIQEGDLVNLVQQITEKKLIMGKDVGVLSYNETPLKALLGIAVISTHFKAMGENAAKMLIENKKVKVKNPFLYIRRNSL